MRGVQHRLGLLSHSHSTRRGGSKSSERDEGTQSEMDAQSWQENFIDSSYPLNMPTEHLHKLVDLRHVLESDLLACDAKWTLFVAAALSYRYDYTLKPFPPRFMQEVSGALIDELADVINETPKLKVMLQYIVEQNFEDIRIDVVELLHWVLVTLRQPCLRLIDEEEVSALLLTVHEHDIPRRPTFVFEVVAAKGFHAEENFRERVPGYPLKLAFCGQNLDQVYSRLQNGFQNDKFEPVFLSTDLLTSIKRSPCGAAWGASQCGSLISCTAVCEFASDAELDKITVNTRKKGSVDIQLHDANMLRVRYLLFYGCRFPKEGYPPQTGILGWVTRHKYSLSLASYLLLLFTIGISNSGSGHALKVYVSKRIQSLLDFCKKIVATE